MSYHINIVERYWRYRSHYIIIADNFDQKDLSTWSIRNLSGMRGCFEITRAVRIRKDRCAFLPSGLGVLIQSSAISVSPSTPKAIDGRHHKGEAWRGARDDTSSGQRWASVSDADPGLTRRWAGHYCPEYSHKEGPQQLEKWAAPADRCAFQKGRVTIHLSN